MSEQLIAVGIVASAGGLEAVSILAQNLPAKARAAYILAQHMSPSHKSLLTTLIARETKLPVQELSGETVLEPDTIYVTPPNSDVIFHDGKLVLTTPSGHPATPKPSGDRLLRSLAEHFGEHSVGVILSGTGSDGSYGVQAIREAGGITIAQDNDSAKYDGMPSSAVKTGCIDLTLPPDKIGQHLHRILSLPRNLDALRDEDEPPSGLADLMRILLSRTRVDFRDYKEATVRRRISRRMSALGVLELDDYVALCRGSMDEVDRLLQDLLISVTAFFRDKEQFDALQRTIESIVDRAPYGPYRIWVPGVATGEEAYSIAILFAEALGGLNQLAQARLQIFGTDLDIRALNNARTGIYPLSALQDVPPAYRNTYFNTVGDRVEVKRELRSAILFSRHNVTQDPPFLNLDLVSIRNVLIYFNNALQERVLSRIHYGLGPQGVLFLGTSETAAAMEPYFEQSDIGPKLFNKRRLTRPPGGHLTPKPSPRNFAPVGDNWEGVPGPKARQHEDNVLFEAVLASIAPVGFLATRGGDIVRVIGDLSRFVELTAASGVRMNVRILRAGLRDQAMNLIAIGKRKAARRTGSWCALGTSGEEARLVCYPLDLPDAAEATFVFAIEARMRPVEEGVDLQTLTEAERTSYVRAIEREMATVREALQQTVEELKTSNEELQSSNEELQSTNEELQATNEELETANEELQSTNEELITVNEEMQVNTAEMERLSIELRMAFDATPFPMLMVDAALLIRHASQAALDFLDLKELPHGGMHLSQCKLPVGLPSASDLCNEALRLRKSRSAQLTSLNEIVDVTATPFVAPGTSISGLLISIQTVELTTLNRMMNVAHEMTGINYWMVDLPSNTLFWSPGVFAIHGRDEALGTPELKDAIDAYHPQDRELVGTAVRRAIEEGAPLDFEARVVRADNGRVVNIRSLGTTIADANGTVTKLVGAFGDVTQDIKNAILLEHYAYVQEAFGIGFYSYDIENDLPYWSRGMSRMLGYDPDTHVPTIQSGLDIIHPEDRERVKGMMKKATEHGTDFEFDTRLLHKSGEQVRCHASGKVRLSQDRVPTHVYGSFRQIAE